MDLFIDKLFTDPNAFFIQLFVVVFSICCHEYAHAQVALLQGDNTAAEQGHLTLNPMKQMGVYSLIMLAFVGIAWGQVPVNPARMKHKWSNALVSFAGPAMNIFLAMGFTFLFSFAITSIGLDKINQQTMFRDYPVLRLAELGATLNFVLFCFNMLPVPMLDGWGVFSYFFPKLGKGQSEFYNGLTVFICFVAIMCIDKLFVGAYFLFYFLVNLLQGF